MEPVKNIVLLSPGKDDVHGGPDQTWFEQLESNLELVLKKYTGKDLKSLTPESKEAQAILAEPVFLILIMHNSYPASGKYIKYLEKIAKDRGETIGHIIWLDTSSEGEEKIRNLFPGAASVVMHEVQDDQSTWIGEGSGAYWSRLLDIAAEARSILETSTSREDDDNTIYLAQTSDDMTMNRNIMKRELLEHGFRVVPVTDLNIHKTDLKSYVQNLVDKSRLVIHLLGNAYGETMEETGESITEVQEKYVAAYLEAINSDPVHAEKEINRLIWIDPEFNPVDSKQEEFINRLKRNIENLHRTEIIQTPLELFKTLVIRRLRKSKPRTSITGRVDDTEPFIYIIHSRDDQKEADGLAESLSKEGLVTGMLNYSKDQRALLNDHKRYLQTSEGALVYYGRPNRPWLRSKVMDMLKAPGLGRTSAFHSMQVLAGKDDLLKDYSPPSGISVTREADLSKAIPQIVKILKQ